MKRNLFSCIFILVVLFALFAFTGCSDGKNNKGTADPTVVSIAVDTATVPQSVYAGKLNVSDIMLIVSYSDETSTKISMTADMLDSANEVKLSTPGTQTVSVAYGGYTAKFSITVLENEKVYYTLGIYNGAPIAVDGVNLVNKPTLDSNGYYENTYESGTKVTIEWVSDGYFFSYWTSNDVKISTASIVEVTVDADYVYRAYSTAVVNTVSFVTYSPSAVVSKTVDKLYSTDIETVSKVGYVFLGWTTDAITEEQSDGGYSENRVVFPYAVTRDVTFYAVWTPDGILYTDSSESTVTVSGFVGEPTELSIPSEYFGKTVTAISPDAFSTDSSSRLTTLTVPSTVKSIGEGAFRGCVRLTSFSVDSSSKYYLSDGGVLFDKTKTAVIAYPAAKITAVYSVPDSVTKISAYAFYDACVGGIVLKNKMTTVGERAFDSAHFDYVDFSAVGTAELSIGNSVFNANIAHIYVSASSKNAYLGFAAFVGFASKVAVVSDGITKLGVIARTEADGTASQLLYRVIENPDFVESGETAEIIAVTRSIADSTIPILADGYDITSIGDYAYNCCTDLSTVKIPYSSKLERIRKTAFDGTPWVESLENDCILVNSVLYTYFGDAKTFILASGVKKIAEAAFEGNKSLVYLDITDNSSLYAIAAHSFDGCTSFKGFICDANPDGGGLYLKNSVETIGSYAFYGTAVTKVELQTDTSVSHNALVSVGDSAFADCRRLVWVQFAAVTENIASTAFVGCSSLEKFAINGKNAVYEAYDGILYEKIGAEYDLFCYPAGRICGVFDPSEVRSYASSITIDESVFINDSEASVGAVVLNGVSYALALNLYGVDKSLTEAKDGAKILTFKDSGEPLSETTAFTRGADGTQVPDGQKYYTFFDNSDGTEKILLYDAERGTYYCEYTLDVTSLGAYSLYYSDIAALYVPSTVVDADKNAVKIPGLVYVEFAGNPVSSYADMFGEYEPSYVVIPYSVSENAVNSYYGNYAKNNVVSANHEFFFSYDASTGSYDKTILYSMNGEGNLYVARTSRTAEEIALPETVTEYSDGAAVERGMGKIISGYAFYGVYLRKVILRNVSEILSDAFSGAEGMTALAVDCDFIVSVGENAFGDKLNNGLYIYDYRNDVNLYKDSESWNLEFFDYKNEIGETESASKYLVLNENGPFAAVVYGDGEDEAAVGIFYGKISASQAAVIEAKLSKTGYYISAWTDESGDSIAADADYDIPYNTVLRCVFSPETYTVYLGVSSDVTLDMEVYETTETMTYYKAAVTFGAEYSFGVKTNALGKILNWRADDGTFTIQNGGTWTYSSENGIFRFNMIYAYVIHFALIDENASLGEETHIVYEGESFILPVPVTTTENKTFVCWRLQLSDGTETTLTRSDGSGVEKWKYSGTNDYYVYAVWSD